MSHGGALQKRWWVVLEQQQAIRQVLSGDRKTSDLVPTWQDVEVLESVQAAIGPLEEQITLSAVRAVLHILRTEVLADSSGDTMLTSDMKSSISDYMESKYSDSDLSELLDVASFLDTRFMTDYIDKGGFDIVVERLVDEGMEYENPVMRQRPNPRLKTLHSRLSQQQRGRNWEAGSRKPSSPQAQHHHSLILQGR